MRDKRPYRHYSETELGKLIAETEQALEAGAPNAGFYQKQLAIAEAELDEREWESA